MVAIRTKTSVPVTTDKKIRVRRFSDFNLDVISDVQFQMFVFPSLSCHYPLVQFRVYPSFALLVQLPRIDSVLAYTQIARGLGVACQNSVYGLPPLNMFVSLLFGEQRPHVWRVRACHVMIPGL